MLAKKENGADKLQAKLLKRKDKRKIKKKEKLKLEKQAKK